MLRGANNRIETDKTSTIKILLKMILKSIKDFWENARRTIAHIIIQKSLKFKKYYRNFINYFN